MTTERVAVNGVELVVQCDGPVDGPLVILSHGFPESSYSWRHQVPVLAGAGYRVLAPDQRGYGQSSCPPNVTDYGIMQLTGDLIALAEWAGHEQAIYVGHDWGALIVWELARLFPERTKAVCGVSVPFTNWPMKPTELMKMIFQDNFFYMLYFQQVGPAERELEADVRATMRGVLFGASGDAYTDAEPVMRPTEGTGFIDMFPPLPETMPAWFTEDDVDHYARQFATSGFFGPVSYYRNLDANWEICRDVPIDRIAMPSGFIGGDKDFVVTRNRAAVDAMPLLLPNFRGSTIIGNAGHWTQQEQPAAFNDALLSFIRQVS